MPILLLPTLANAITLLLPIGLVIGSIALIISLVGIVARRLPTGSLLRRMGMPGQSNPALGKAFGWASTLLWMAITALHWLAWQLVWVEGSADQLNLATYLSSLLVLLLAWRLLADSVPERLARVSPIALQVVQVAGLAWCIQLSLHETELHNFVETPPGTLVACRTAHTDMGTSIQLYDRQVKAGELSKFYSATAAHIAKLARFAMFRSEAQPQINCHGWVFSGEHIIKGDDVPTILNENGYRQVANPQLSDLVIYTNTTGTPVHTGLVCGFIGDMALIESKWGVAGTYVHCVDEQPYSLNFHFYRSPRSGHQLKNYEPVKGSVVSHIGLNRVPDVDHAGWR